MISGVGIDVVKIDRMKRWISNEDLLERYFHPEEIKDVMKKRFNNRGLESLAARFAAKEAFGKALGCGLCGMSLRNIRVCLMQSGKPELLLYGDAMEVFKKGGQGNIHLSLSHDGGIAAAFVVIERYNAVNNPCMENCIFPEVKK